MRWIFRIVTAVVFVAALAVGALFLLPAERIAGLVSDQFKAATGRDLTIAGDIRPTLLPELGISTGAVSIANADWGQGGPLLQAEGLTVGVDWGALFGGAIQVTRVQAEAPRITLEVAKDGRGNWALAQSADEASTGAPSATGSEASVPALSLDKAVISGGRVVFIDHASGVTTELRDIDATASLPAFDGPATVSLRAVMNGQAFLAEARLASLSGFLTGGAVGTELQAKVGGASLDFDGASGLSPLAAGGRINADLADQGALFALIGAAAPDLPRGLGQKISVEGDMTFTEDKITLRDAAVALDHNLLVGAADVALGGRPHVTAQLSAAALDFSALAGAEDAGAAAERAAAEGAATASAGWPTDRIDVSALQSVDADVVLAAESIDLGRATLGRTSIRTALSDGRAVTTIRELAAYGGAVSGSMVVNSRGGLSARANLQAAGIAMQPLLQEMAGYDRVLASGDLTLNVLAVGDDMATLMRSLSGDGALSLGQGELRGLDLVGMLRNLDASYVGEGARTIFDAMTGSFTLEGGVLRNEDLVLSAPLLIAKGAGVVDIGAMGQEYRLVPALLEGQGNGGLRVPLLISGTWADPKFRLDLEALAEQELADEVEAVKAQAETVVTDRINEELGTNLEGLNDADEVLKEDLRNRAEKELEDAAGGLLRGLLGGD
ncbi:AsmA family protein [Candidatus Rhodobacter oscarellae]|uniref:AsmA family protein n=1 Tax=Candidatus Rhodobacter oscarellae TaxID=1675527 RepID=A0A0J9E4X7_9RHOB|nr:AsmA family protein [Candidatus Rhodobacter lobularis]KMW57855.1 AsmA family protein [Candidatus Rhodobacter lobularis]